MPQIGTIIILVLILVIFGCIAYAVYRIKNAVRSFSQAAFGTDSLKEGFEQVEEEYSATPKSVSAMTSLRNRFFAERSGAGGRRICGNP